MRIEQWQMEQSQALLDEIEKQTRRKERYIPTATATSNLANLGAHDELVGTTPKQGDISGPSVEPADDIEPLWKRVMRRFIRDVIGIDESLLSVIVDETLPEDIYAIADLVNRPETDSLPHEHFSVNETWTDHLLYRIVRELGLLVNKLSSHPGAFTTSSSNISSDYAGMLISE